jgi:hypothetical protein
MIAQRAQFAIWFALLSLTACGEPTSEVDEASLAVSSSAGPGTSSNNLTSTAVSKTQIDLSWQDEAPNETGWQVHRSTSGPAGAFTLLATTGANVTGYSDTGLTPLTQYCYRVRWFRTTGKKTSFGEFSTTSCSTTPAPPSAPSNADARPASSTAVDLNWADNSGTEDGFLVERSASAAGPWETAATTGANATSYTDQGRASEEPACYRVVAFNAHGNSGPSNVDCTTPPAAPGPVVVTEPYPQWVALNWNDNSAIEDGYRVWIRFFAPLDGYYVLFSHDLPPGATHFEDYIADDTCNREYTIWALKDGGTSDALYTGAGPGCGASVLGAGSASGGLTRPARPRP